MKAMAALDKRQEGFDVMSCPAENGEGF